MPNFEIRLIQTTTRLISRGRARGIYLYYLTIFLSAYMGGKLPISPVTQMWWEFTYSHSIKIRNISRELKLGLQIWDSLLRRIAYFIFTSLAVIIKYSCLGFIQQQEGVIQAKTTDAEQYRTSGMIVPSIFIAGPLTRDC